MSGIHERRLELLLSNPLFLHFADEDIVTRQRRAERLLWWQAWDYSDRRTLVGSHMPSRKFLPVPHSLLPLGNNVPFVEALMGQIMLFVGIS